MSNFPSVDESFDRLHRAFHGTGTDGHHDHEPEQPEEHAVVRGVVRLVLLDRQEAAAEAGDARGQGERDDARPSGIDADRGCGRLADARCRGG